MAASVVMKRLASFLAVFAFATVGCHSDDHDHSDRPAVCAEIIERCHPLDLGSGPIHECHEGAESTWDEATCTAKKASCFAVCTAPTDGGGDGEVGADTGAADSGAVDASDAKTDAPGEAATDAAGDAASDAASDATDAASDAASDAPAG